MLYSYGPSDYATYAFALITLILLAFLTISQKSKISVSRRHAVWIWMGVWFAAAVTQFLFPKLLLVGFASALGMLVLYLKLENPGNNLDRQTGLFNHGAFIQYIVQLNSLTIFAHFTARMCSKILETRFFSYLMQFLPTNISTRYSNALSMAGIKTEIQSFLPTASMFPIPLYRTTRRI